MLCAPGTVVSTTVGSRTSCGGCGHGHAMAGGEKLSAAVGDGARGRERRGRAQERQRRLTADPFEAETRPGMVRSRRIERRRVPVAEEGNGVVGGDAGLPASRELVGTKRKARRFLWKHRRGEGWTLAAVELVGALGCSWSIVREREQRG